MFILKSKDQLAKAIERARAIRPRVRVQSFGRYAVEGQATTYTVTCERRNGIKLVDCSCVAGQYGSACYHAASAIGLHMCLAAQNAH